MKFVDSLTPLAILPVLFPPMLTGRYEVSPVPRDIVSLFDFAAAAVVPHAFVLPFVSGLGYSTVRYGAVILWLAVLFWPRIRTATRRFWAQTAGFSRRRIVSSASPPSDRFQAA
ncbi:MAG: hypothetical protein R3D45_16830 [Rhizobiaceae bacterium]